MPLEMVHGGRLINGFSDIFAGRAACRHESPQSVAAMHDDAIVAGWTGRKNFASPQNREGEHQHQGENLDEGNEAAAWRPLATIHDLFDLRVSRSNVCLVAKIVAKLRRAVKNFSNRCLHSGCSCANILTHTGFMTGGR